MLPLSEEVRKAKKYAPALQAFARLSAVYGGTYMLSKPDAKVVYTPEGKFAGRPFFHLVLSSGTTTLRALREAAMSRINARPHLCLRMANETCTTSMEHM